VRGLMYIGWGASEEVFFSEQSRLSGGSHISFVVDHRLYGTYPKERDATDRVLEECVRLRDQQWGVVVRQLVNNDVVVVSGTAREHIERYPNYTQNTASMLTYTNALRQADIFFVTHA